MSRAGITHIKQQLLQHNSKAQFKNTPLLLPYMLYIEKPFTTISAGINSWLRVKKERVFVGVQNESVLRPLLLQSARSYTENKVEYCLETPLPPRKVKLLAQKRGENT